ncbi:MULTISPECIES: type II secretion system F family protein [Kytococcus]|uniref:Type II secretion system protein GspF domain-containing protein n=1 Tax=Kytococcus schroeteri TaxID=138300 RepID=A0A2I1PC84_9MICO|nr:MULTISPECIES: type II secretion system F family protein [Kytococcus]PKZ42201.1 hypothetical protein CYJ76_03925 [Kytococcus schroeteri]
MVVVTGVLVALLVLGAGVLWPVRARHEVVLGLSDLAGRRERAARQQATVASVRGLLAVDPVAATGTGVRGLLGRARARFGTVRVTDDAVLRLLDGLSSALSAGLPPHAALEVVASAGPQVPWLDPVRRAAAAGSQLGPAWKELATQHESPALRHVASAWALSERSGAALAPAVATAADTVRRSRESRQTAQAAASGAMASMYMLSLLPLVGLAGSSVLGWSPRELYLEQPLGLASAVLGVVLLVVGWAVSRRLVRRALRGQVVR